MARHYAVDDSEWVEVKLINGYALFMGYLMMGVRGLGLLVITWSTVVLLGGFVSALEKNDFWCLTGITLIQTAGVFNFLLSEKLSDMVHLWWGLLGSAVGTVVKIKIKSKAEEDEDISIKRILLAFAFSAIQGVVLFVVLCPVAILYVFGLGISAGASLWRLIKHDFGSDGGANKKPALQVLYCLAVAQGALFGYKMIHALAAKGGLVNLVYNQVGKQLPEKLVAEYLEETVAGCEKDPSFATGRNFVTYGVNLMMEAKSSEGFIAGIKVLGATISGLNSGRKVLAKYYLLIRSDSSLSPIIQRLLETVGPRSPYSREIKEHVVRILDIIARSIPLEQFPRAIECLCSVVDIYEDPNKKSRGYGNIFKDYDRVELLEEYEKDYLENGKRGENKIKENRRGFDQLLVIATNIIYKLVADENNTWIMRTCVPNTMLHKIAMFPTKLHRENHDPFAGEYRRSYPKMLEQCWALTERLLVVLTETSRPPLLPAATPVGEGRQRGRRRSEEIEEEEEGEEQLLLRSMDGSAALGSSVKCNIKDSIESTIRCIFDCLDCGGTVKRQAIQILLHLSWDMSCIIKDDSESSKRRLRWILLLILCCNGDDSKYWMVPSLTYWNKDCCDFDGIRRLAGEKLSEMLREKKHELPSEETVTELHGLALDLKSAFHDDSHDISIRTHAILIMEGLCHLDYETGGADCTPLDYAHFFELESFMVDAIPEVVKETLTLCGSETAESQEQATDVETGNDSQDNQDGCIDTRRLRNALVLLCFSYLNNPNLRIRYLFKRIASKTCKEQGKSFGDLKRLLGQFHRKFT